MTINTADATIIVARRITITGVVQGVGFRPFVYNLASEMELNGWVLNHSGGVDIEVEGPEPDVAAFVAALEAKAPPLAHIESLDAQAIPPRDLESFEIRHSESQEGRYQLISPDVATCPDCLAELLDPEDRRYRYPFINCTNCGPRFTIIQDIPYDRPKTTMRVFPMCDDCREEYQDPRDRRFHAQPNACPVCGPRVWLIESANEGLGELTNDQIDKWANGDVGPSTAGEVRARERVFERTRELLLEGKILAIKGLGGFHLACDATNAKAVAMLRERKQRPHKPFAVMVPTLDDVRDLCTVPPEAKALLTSPQCPIVLLDTVEEPRTASGLRVGENVAPNSHTLGVMIPYTPLHHILLRDVGRPLVMTSGNLTEEPIAKDNDEALRRLAPLADAFLLHDRDIHARYDDSVVQVVEGVNDRISKLVNQRVGGTADAGGIVVPVRRARGYAPHPVRLPFEVGQIFAAGPLLKNTFTLTRDGYAFVSQHIGDLENLDTLAHYEAALETYQHLFRIEPERVASDLHPDYLSTRFAATFAEDHGLPSPIGVQHHQAHIASCLADNGWADEQGKVIGVALDGTGYGTDGKIWGGEWFVGDYNGFERVAHLAYLPLPGGDAAIKHPWRIAIAYLHALGLDDALPLGEYCPGDVMRVRTMVDRRLNTPQTSSMGRLFDAVSALLGLCTTTTYEAQAAIKLEQAMGRLRDLPDPAEISPYPFEIDTAPPPYRIGVASLFEEILADVARSEDTATISGRFHATVAGMVVETCRHVREVRGLNTVALSGGVFQNRHLTAMVVPQLRATGFDVLMHTQVPPNDGGISLGQAVMAAKSLADASVAETSAGSV